MMNRRLRQVESRISVQCTAELNELRRRELRGFKQGCGAGPDLGGHEAQGPRPPTKRGPPTKPFNFYFALTIG